MIRLTEETEKDVLLAIKAAHSYALSGIETLVVFDAETGSARTEYSGYQLKEGELLVTTVWPYTLAEIYGDDEDLAADPEGFRRDYFLGNTGVDWDDDPAVDKLEDALEEREKYLASCDDAALDAEQEVSYRVDYPAAAEVVEVFDLDPESGAVYLGTCHHLPYALDYDICLVPVHDAVIGDWYRELGGEGSVWRAAHVILGRWPHASRSLVGFYRVR